MITLYMTASETQQVSVWAQAGDRPSVAQLLDLPWNFALCTLYPAPLILALLHDTSLTIFFPQAG